MQKLERSNCRSPSNFCKSFCHNAFPSFQSIVENIELRIIFAVTTLSALEPQCENLAREGAGAGARFHTFYDSDLRHRSGQATCATLPLPCQIAQSFFVLAAIADPLDHAFPCFAQIVFRRTSSKCTQLLTEHRGWLWLLHKCFCQTFSERNPMPSIKITELQCVDRHELAI